MKYDLYIVDWKTDSTVLKNLREKVFVLEWQLPPTIEFDTLDESAFHVVARDNIGDNVATARMTKAGEIGRIAVKPKHRALTLYKALFSKLLELAQQHKIEQVTFRCNLDGVDSMTKHGFRPQGRVFMEAGIPMQCLACPSANLSKLPDIRQLH